jgi:hypothetical protein
MCLSIKYPDTNDGPIRKWGSGRSAWIVFWFTYYVYLSVRSAEALFQELLDGRRRADAKLCSDLLTAREWVLPIGATGR